MIISHKYRFIFIKTEKTAGTSVETYLSPLCGESDVFTPFGKGEPGHQARNYRGHFNPIPEILLNLSDSAKVIREWRQGRRFYNHMPGFRIRCRIAKTIWNSYYKFCIERNPWDKTLSHFYFLRGRFTRYRDLTFDDYLEKGISCINYPKYTNYHDPDEIIVNRILKYENINEELSDVFGQLGILFKEPLSIFAKGQYRVNRDPYQKVLKPHQVEAIADIYRQEIKLLEYAF